jgi:AbrB family looped-hinge helix DNA binding protein
VGKVTEAAKYDATPTLTGEILGRRKIQDRGRVQIPDLARKKLNIKDGDHVYWVEGLDRRIYITKVVTFK